MACHAAIRANRRAAARRDERAAARHGAHRALRSMQPRPADLAPDHAQGTRRAVLARSLNRSRQRPPAAAVMSLTLRTFIASFTRLGWRLPTLVVTLFGLLAGCAGFDAQQRKWIFQAATVPVSRRPDGRQRADRRRHGGRLDRARLAAQRPADPPACAVARARRRRCAGPAVPARRAPRRRRQRVPDPPDERARLLGARGRLPRLRPQHRRAAVGSDRLRGRARRLALARRARGRPRPLCVRPFARRRDRGPARERGRPTRRA